MLYSGILVKKCEWWCALPCKQTLDTSVLGNVDYYTVAQMALGFRRFLAHQVAHPGPIALDFTRTGHRETLLGAGVGFHFRHNNTRFIKWSAKIRILPCKKEAPNKKRLRNNSVDRRYLPSIF